MNHEKMFLCVIAALSLAFAIYNGISMACMYHRSACTKGTVVTLMSPGPERVKRCNSKWAEDFGRNHNCAGLHSGSNILVNV